MSNLANTHSRPITPGGKAPQVSSDRESVNRLQRNILRMALTYHGEDPQLDRQLKRFGRISRGDGSHAERAELIDEIVAAVLSIKEKKSSEATVSEVGIAQPMVDFLGHLRTPESLAPEIEQSRKAFECARDRSAVLNAVETTASIISAQLMSADGDAANSSLCKELLLELLERLPISKNLVRELAPVRRAIENATEASAYQDCVGSIVKLIEALRAELQSEISGLEGFIKKIAARLTDFDRFVKHTESIREAGANDTLQLSDTIELEISGLRNEAANCNDIETVRGIIEDRLDNIDSGLTVFAASQREREAESKSALEDMTNKLRALEAQTETLREDLERQHDRVVLDPLTGVYNRTGYNETAAKLFARWKRYGGKLSLAVIDLDLFKHINDEYGHAAGDRVLATVAGRIKDQIRESDMLCRYGGEEFVLMLPETSIDDAAEMLEKLREDIAQCPFRYKDTPVNITLSCGVAEFTAGDMLEDAFERADRAMYEAKTSGRNQVCAVDAKGSRLRVAA